MGKKSLEETFRDCGAIVKFALKDLKTHFQDRRDNQKPEMEYLDPRDKYAYMASTGIKEAGHTTIEIDVAEDYAEQIIEQACALLHYKNERFNLMPILDFSRD
jgi:hypothetical protein